MPEAAKPGWKTPELIVLERSKPEEAVLCSCKVAHTWTAPWSTYSGCVSMRWEHKGRFRWEGHWVCSTCACEKTSPS